MGNGTLFLNTVNYLAAQENLIGIEPAHRRPAPGQPHQPADEGHLLPVGAPRARPARRGGHRGVVEAAVSRGSAALARAVWLLLGVLAVGDRGARVHRPSARRSGEAARADPRLLLPVPLGRARARSRSRTPGGSTASSATRRGAWFYHGVHTASPRAPTRTTPDPALRGAHRARRRRASVGRASSGTSRSGATDGAAYGVTAPRDRHPASTGPGQSQPLVQYAVGHVAPDTVSRYVMAVGQPVVVTIPDVPDRQPAGPRSGRWASAHRRARAAGTPMRAACARPGAALALLAAASAGAASPTPAAATATPRSRSTARRPLHAHPVAGGVPPAVAETIRLARAGDPARSRPTAGLRPRQGDARSPRAALRGRAPDRCPSAPSRRERHAGGGLHVRRRGPRPADP